MKTLLSPFGGAAIVLSLLMLAPETALSQSGDQEKAMYYSLYYEDFKNENYAGALQNLQWILQNAPGFPRNNDRNFERAVKVFREMAVAEEDLATRQAYFDSALVIFDTAVSRLQDANAEVSERDWIFAKGKFIQENAEHLPDLQPMITDLYRQAYDLEPQKLQPYYMNYIIAGYAQKGDKQAAVDFIDVLDAEFPENEEVRTMLTNWRGALFTSPEERFDFISSQLEKDPSNCQFILEKFELALDLGFRDDVYQLEQRVLNCEATSKTFFLLGVMKLEDGEADQAFGMFEQAMGMPDGNERAKDIYYNMGIAQQQLGRLSRARTYFRRALDIDRNYGAAYMAIGDLYVTAVSNCGSFEREDRAVYWLVTDYYDRARSVDPTVAGAAQRKSRQYRAYYPDQEALFFKGWQVGQRYVVDYGCYGWISEATTVKSP
ncbi:MAG: tetratricopeptide repeat protein [Rhodothermales bacterium]|nr:tetratricopeptide repeat protein [Rhodothermales bacterium]